MYQKQLQKIRNNFKWLNNLLKTTFYKAADDFSPSPAGIIGKIFFNNQTKKIQRLKSMSSVLSMPTFTFINSKFYTPVFSFCICAIKH